MNSISHSHKALLLAAALAMPLAPVAAQDTADGDIDVYGERLAKGPVVEGIISARKDEKLQITAEDGSQTVVIVDDGTKVRSKGGFLGLGSKDRTNAALLNGLPVKIETLQSGYGLIASEIAFKNDDLEMASMIRNGTSQQFAEQTAATDALRARVGDIDEYNVKGTTNVYFDTGKYSLTQQARADLCGATQQANQTDNALLLVVGYTDSVGDYEYNQELSEKRASRVVNFLQQECGWKPYRMLTPTGMAEADPAADNTTDQGKAQNRRVAVNIMVSKSVEGL